MPIPMPNKNPKKPANWSKVSKQLSFWVFVILVPIAIIQFSGKGAEAAPEIPYTPLYDHELQTNNIDKVTIQAGRLLTGEFKQKVPVKGRLVSKFKGLLPTENSSDEVARDFYSRILLRQKNLELRDETSLHRNLLLELSRQQSTGLDSDLVDVVRLQLVIVQRSIGNLGRRLGALPRKLDDRDGHQYDENPERELLRNLAPVRRLLGILVRHRYRHYCKLAMYGKWRKFSA